MKKSPDYNVSQCLEWQRRAGSAAMRERAIQDRTRQDTERLREGLHESKAVEEDQTPPKNHTPEGVNVQVQVSRNLVLLLSTQSKGKRHHSSWKFEFQGPSLAFQAAGME